MFERRPPSGQDYYGSDTRESDMFERRPHSGQDYYGSDARESDVFERAYQSWEKDQTKDNRWDQLTKLSCRGNRFYVYQQMC